MYHGAMALARLSTSVAVDIFARLEKGEPHVFSLHPRVRVIRLPLGPVDQFMPKECYWGEPILSFLKSVEEYTARRRLSYDLLHGHYADGWYVAHRLAERWNKPLICSTHSLGKRKLENALRSSKANRRVLEQKYAFRKRIQHESEAIRAASRICALTHEEARYLEDKYGADSERLRVVYHGINTSDFYGFDGMAATLIQNRLGIRRGERVVLNVGRLDERKGQRELVAAMPKIAAWASSKALRVRFIFLGWLQSELARELERQIDAVGLAEQTILLGPVPHDEVAAYYWASDVVAVSSSYDVLPFAMMEAMAAGKPVVGTTNGGPAEIINSGSDGILVDVTKPEKLAEAITTLLGDRELATRLGLTAQQRMLKEFSWEQSARRTLSVYREVFDGVFRRISARSRFPNIVPLSH